ncbi:MAG TPA: phage virion morphogenesis protein [Gemmatimonadales bacterium]|jgi:hypothetical protein
MSAPTGILAFEMTVLGLERVEARLAAIIARTQDFRPVWPDVVKAFQAITTKAFATEGASTEFGAWTPLAPATLKERERLGFGAGPILERTGALRRALTLGEGADVVMEPQRMQYVLSPNVSYFAYHQSTEPRKRLPRRPPVSLTAADHEALINPIALWLIGRDPGAPGSLGNPGTLE